MNPPSPPPPPQTPDWFEVWEGGGRGGGRRVTLEKCHPRQRVPETKKCGSTNMCARTQSVVTYDGLEKSWLDMKMCHRMNARHTY